MANEELILAVVSLVIAIIAFVVAVAQALQQFAASAEGYRLCREGVMGLWGKRTKRVFTWEEFRFKVMIRTPVLFVAPPNNKFGPVKDRPIYNIDGTLDSYKSTYCRVPSQQDHDAKAGSLRVHTADDEYASWVVLMETLHKADVEARQWDHKFSTQTSDSPRNGVQSTIVVQVQEKKRSWDQMPDAVKKPFATSNISHILEIAALLGMQWVAFDQDTWNMRAEGNGFMLLSQTVWGLGVSVSFSVTGKAKFAENRMIPCPGMKELLFGTVDTIFSGLQLNFEPKKDAWEDMYITQKTLRRLKLDRRAIEKYFNRKEHSVIRSVSFEMIAMLGKVYRIPGSNFKRLPNPTPDPWLSDLSPCKILSEYQGNIARVIHRMSQDSEEPSERLTWIDAAWREVLQPVWKEHAANIDIDMRDAVQSVIESCDSYLQTYGEATVMFVIGAHVSIVLEEINDPDSFLHSRECDTEEEIWFHYFDVIREKVLRHDGKSAAEKVVEKTGNILGLPVNGTKPASIYSVSRTELRQDIWLLLMFRMSLWWLLHDFDEKDVLILPPRLKGNRMPVYIL
ncbi:hypothetical protein Slin15195_G068520 [Septoria linicola]|uniref:Modin n=1 Tax=Septoria linicola TaxID=215465 RepID=A0A9Q9AWT4_9PEZI|nr:hypothetical protein Slin15195_G068520 [Septoria linicola]